MHYLALNPDMTLSIEPAVAQRRNVYETARQVLGRVWSHDCQRFLPQLQSDSGKVGEFLGGFHDAYHLAVMRILIENERWQLATGDYATARMCQKVLERPVILLAPARPNLPGRPEEGLPHRLLHSMLSNLLTYFEDIHVCGRRTRYLDAEEMVEVLEGVRPHAWPETTVYKYLCIVAELDRAYSEDTMPLVHRMIRELERIFVGGGKGDVFYFFDKPFGVAPMLKSLHNMVGRM